MQFFPYNTALRQWPVREYDEMKKAGNLFVTTIHVLVSAVQKIARAARLPEGLRLYRGLGWLTDLPESFLRVPAAGGVRGYTEWGFMSTTADKRVAVRYSGAAEGRPPAMLLEIVIGAVDRGACIVFASQYPKEAEYLWLPCSFMAPGGHIRLEAAAGAGLVRVVPVRANANLTARTLEELVAQKKRTHVASFRFLVAEVRTDLQRIAEESAAAARLANDATKVKLGSKGGLAGLIEHVHSQCQVVLRNHEQRPPEDYTKDSVYRGLVTEALDVKAWAVSKFRLWLEDQSQLLFLVVHRPLRTAHRDLIAFLKRGLACLPAKDCATRRVAAERLCKLRGLLENSVEETNEVGEDRLTCAAADGVAGIDLQMLLAAAGFAKSPSTDGMVIFIGVSPF